MKKIIGITMGDAAGIGPEITIKALADKSVYEKCIPIVFGDNIPLQDAINYTESNLKLRNINSPEEALGEYGTVDCINFDIINSNNWQYGEVSAICGGAAFDYIVKAIDFAMKGQLDAVVTGPINKESLHLSGHHFSGHTEIFAHYTNTEKYGMLLVSPGLKVIHVTTHVSMRQACDIILQQPERIVNAIRLANEAMNLLGKPNPRIAVAGFNAHSSENGIFGNEEAESIIPAIKTAQSEGLNVDGPVPPDSVFIKALGGQYDIVVAMYHDQGHIPLKLSGFKIDPATGQFTSLSGVNISIGMPIIRTSVDHGTAFDKAGKGVAVAESMTDAIDMAVTMAENKSRKET